ncbi:MAG: DUF3619 family protein [Rhodocyclaceae bacterium]|nr:DUF3619 family protein [Rhodocyclaceae bacterium]MCP5308703.1 DUF3619 family protein [Zoogloeaceae bacterium]
MMTERRVARKMTLVLDRGVDRLDVRTASRLAASRRQALGMLGAPGGAGSRRGAWRFLLAPLARGLAALLLVGGVVIAADYWKGEQLLRESSEVDAALLSDDLPIDAYLDSGFRAWLAEDARS